MRTCSSLTLHEGTPLCGAVSCRFDGFWDHQSQLLMTSAQSLEVSATGPSEKKERLDILEPSAEKLKSNGSSDMAHPASMEFDPFRCH